MMLKMGKRYFNEEYRYREDQLYWLSMLKDNCRNKGNVKILATYRIRKNSLSRNKFNLIKKSFLFYIKFKEVNVIQRFYFFSSVGIQKSKKE